jgi:hypothetical protein
MDYVTSIYYTTYSPVISLKLLSNLNKLKLCKDMKSIGKLRQG